MRFGSLACFLPLVFLTACGGGSGSGSGGGPTNQSPTANPQDSETSEDLSVDITLTGSDGDGSVASFNVTSEPPNGTLEGVAPDLTYVPNVDYNGGDSFQFTVTDNDGAVSSPATVTLTVHSVNDPPLANPLEVSTTEDESVTITLSGSDRDGTIVDYLVLVQPSHGVLFGDPPELEYIPNWEWSGDDWFEYSTEDDGHELSEPARVTISVEEAEDDPRMPDHWFRLWGSSNPNNSKRVSPVIVDNDSDWHTLEITQQPSFGTAEYEDRKIVYRPVSGFRGEDEVHVRAEDSDGNQSEVAVFTFLVLDRSPSIEQELMEEFYDTTGGDTDWLVTTNWMTDADLEDWFGLTIHNDWRVQTMELPDNGLTGAYFSKVGEMSDLQHLRLQDSAISGAFEPNWINNNGLRDIVLARNSLEGSIPAAMGRVHSLERLDVQDNQLSGSLPYANRRLEKLIVLRVGGNDFSGPLVPEEFFPINVEIVDVSDNQLEGPVPVSLLDRPSLRRLYIEDSGLSGRLPLSFTSRTGLEEFRYAGTSGDICAPGDSVFQDWINSIPNVDRNTCDVPPTLTMDKTYYVHHVTTGITDRVTDMEIFNRGDSALEVTVTTSDSWLTASQTFFTIEAFRSNSLYITIDCADATRRIGSVTLSTNDPNRAEHTIHVDVTCLDRTLTLRVNEPADAFAGGPDQLLFPIVASFVMESDTDDEEPEPYSFALSIPSNPAVALVDESATLTGLAFPGETISLDFTGECLREGSATATATVTIGSLEATGSYDLECEPDKARVHELTWWQVPWVQKLRFVYEGTAVDNPEKVIEPNTWGPEESDSHLLEHRDSVVGVTFGHAYSVRREEVTNAQWLDDSSDPVDLVKATEHELHEVHDEDSEWKWGTEFYFHLPADMTTGADNARFLLRVDLMEDDFQSLISDQDFSPVVDFRPVFLPYVAEQGDDPDPAPDWDDDDLLEYTRQFLPIAKEDRRRYDTLWLDPDDLDGSFNDNFLVLDLTLQEWLLVGEADEFFHGLRMNGINGYFADMGGVAYLGWQSGMSAVWMLNDGSIVSGLRTVAHEFGHNLDLRHVNCGGAGSPDPNYPHPGGRIGPEKYWSWLHDDFITGDSHPEYRDFMSYCPSPFTSDYSYPKAADYYVRKSTVWDNDTDSSPMADLPTGSIPRSIAFMARVNLETEEWTILQSMHSFKEPLPSKGGDHELVVFDSDGIEAYRRSVVLMERMIRLPTGEHVEDRERTVAVRMPIPQGGMGSIQILDELGKELFASTVDVEKPPLPRGN